MLAGTILFHLFQIFVDLIVLSVIRKKQRFRELILPILIWFAVSMLIAAIVGENGFGRMRLGLYAIFIHAVLMSFAVCIVFWSRNRKIAATFLICALALGAIGIHSFFIEPYRLQETDYFVKVPELKSEITIAVISDLQTDHFTDYERTALTLVMKRKPDMILMTGDYLQPTSDIDGAKLHDQFNEHLRSINLSAPLGAYAVRGDTEGPAWKELFSGVPIKPLEETQTIKVLNFDLTALSRKDSRNTEIQINRPSKYHIVFGHSPNFALGKIDADLLIAGHTHGGQIRFPVAGPLYVHSKIPRKWAAGKTELAPKRTLIVSSGIGMERGYAPRLRFLCRPEIVYVHLVPVEPK